MTSDFKMILGFDPKAVVARTIGLQITSNKSAGTFSADPEKRRAEHAAYQAAWRKVNVEKVQHYQNEKLRRNLARGLTANGRPRKRPFYPRRKRIESGQPTEAPE